MKLLLATLLLSTVAFAQEFNFSDYGFQKQDILDLCNDMHYELWTSEDQTQDDTLNFCTTYYKYNIIDKKISNDGTVSFVKLDVTPIQDPSKHCAVIVFPNTDSSTGKKYSWQVNYPLNQGFCF